MSASGEFTQSNPKLFVVIPTYNRWHEARQTLSCLQQSTYDNFEIILIEDGCTDGTAEFCAQEFPDVHRLHGDGNLWWSGAINKGVEYALGHGAQAIVWLNDDNRVEPETLSEMVKSFGRNGTRSVICARTKSIDTGADEWIGEPPIWRPEARTWRPPDLSVADVPVAYPPGGRGVLFPAECFREVGLIDARTFPHYWADHDFHYRAMNAGYRYFVATRAAVWNVANKQRLTSEKLFSLAGIGWFLFSRRSPMNMPTVRRLLKRHLSRSEYRATFFPLLARHLGWLSYGWLQRKPALASTLRKVKRGLLPEKTS